MDENIKKDITPPDVPDVPFPPAPPMRPPWSHFRPPQYTPFRVCVPPGLRGNCRPNFAWTDAGLTAQEQYYELRSIVMDMTEAVNKYGQYVDWIINIGIEKEVLYHMHEYVDPLVEDIRNSIADLQTQIHAVDVRVSANTDSIASLTQTVVDLTNKVNSEISRLDSRVDTLNSALQTEINRATAAENRVDQDSKNRDTALDTKISDETSRAVQAEGELQQEIDNEVDRAKEVESDLSARIDDITAAGIVTSVNGITDDVAVVGGTNVTVQNTSNNVTVAVADASTTQAGAVLLEDDFSTNVRTAPTSNLVSGLKQRVEGFAGDFANLDMRVNAIENAELAITRASIDWVESGPVESTENSLVKIGDQVFMTQSQCNINSNSLTLGYIPAGFRPEQTLYGVVGVGFQTNGAGDELRGKVVVVDERGYISINQTPDSTPVFFIPAMSWKVAT